MIYLTWMDAYKHYAERSNIQQFFALQACLQCFLVYLLNGYWYLLILKGLKKLMQEAGVMAKTDSKEFAELDNYDTSVSKAEIK